MRTISSVMPHLFFFHKEYNLSDYSAQQDHATNILSPRKYRAEGPLQCYLDAKTSVCISFSTELQVRQLKLSLLKFFVGHNSLITDLIHDFASKRITIRPPTLLHYTRLILDKRQLLTSACFLTYAASLVSDIYH